MELPRAKLYLAFALLMLITCLAIAVYTWIENFIIDRKADKRKIVFRTKDGMTKGYWKTKKGEVYDEHLKIEDE